MNNLLIEIYMLKVNFFDDWSVSIDISWIRETHFDFIVSSCDIKVNKYYEIFHFRIFEK